MFPDAVRQFDVASHPFAVAEAGYEDGRIRIEGPLDIRCLTEFDRLCGVRISERQAGAGPGAPIRHHAGHGPRGQAGSTASRPRPDLMPLDRGRGKA